MGRLGSDQKSKCMHQIINNNFRQTVPNYSLECRFCMQKLAFKLTVLYQITVATVDPSHCANIFG